MPFKKPGLMEQALRKSSRRSERLTRSELVAHCKKHFPAAFDALPPTTDLLFLDQCSDPNAGGKKLLVGHVKVADQRLQLWAVIKHPTHVDFRYGLDTKATLDQRNRFDLLIPFYDTAYGPKKMKKPELEAVIAGYFVMSGFWDTFADGSDKSVSLDAFRKGCESIMEAVTWRKELEMEMIEELSREETVSKQETTAQVGVDEMVQNVQAAGEVVDMTVKEQLLRETCAEQQQMLSKAHLRLYKEHVDKMMDLAMQAFDKDGLSDAQRASMKEVFKEHVRELNELA